METSEAALETMEKKGVNSGLFCKHPISGNDVPIWIANFVLMGYGTGAVMSVPAHDQRDYEFAKKYSIFFEGEQVRHDNDIRVATNPFDFVIASFQNSMSMRDVYAARASEEVVRELVIRIPIVNSFIEEEEQRIKDKINTKLSYLPTPETGILNEDKDGNTASLSVQDKTETVSPKEPSAKEDDQNIEYGAKAEIKSEIKPESQPAAKLN